MNFGIIKDGKLIFASKNHICEDGKIITNFNKNENLMKQNGFKKVVNNIPEYDKKTQYVSVVDYTELEDSIIVNYEVKNIELTIEQKKQKNMNKCLELFAETLGDERASLVPLLFEEWKIGVKYKKGKRIVYQEVLYKVLKNHTSQESLTPDTASNLYVKLLAQTIDEIIQK